MIYIDHYGEKIRFENADDAIDFLQKSKQELFKKEYSRDCDKCVWQHSISCFFSSGTEHGSIRYPEDYWGNKEYCRQCYIFLL